MQEMLETWVQSLGQEDLLEHEMATHYSILAWKIAWTRGTWRTIVHGVTKSWTQMITHEYLACCYVTSVGIP